VKSRWRQAGLQVIARLWPRYSHLRGAELRAAVNAHYPWGPRQHHPYRVWLQLLRDLQQASNPESWLGNWLRPTCATDDVPGQLQLWWRCPSCHSEHLPEVHQGRECCLYCSYRSEVLQ
jgi:hypothetical protein